VTLGFALVAALLIAGSHLGFRRDVDDSWFVLTFVLGWTAAFWAVLIGVFVAVGTLRRDGPRSGVFLLLSTVVLVAIVVAHPLTGSGSASA